MNWTIKRSDESKEKFDKLKVIFAMALILAIAYAAIFRSIVFPILGLIVMFASTAEYFLGRKFVLAETYAKAGATEIDWKLVKSVHVQESSIYLSPFGAESKLDAFRGVKLIIQNVSKENVLEFVQNHVGEDVRFLGKQSD